MTRRRRPCPPSRWKTSWTSSRHASWCSASTRPTTTTTPSSHAPPPPSSTKPPPASPPTSKRIPSPLEGEGQGEGHERSRTRLHQQKRCALARPGAESPHSSLFSQHFPKKTISPLCFVNL